MKPSLWLWALAITAALNATPTLAQSSNISMTQEQIHSRVIELCNMSHIQKNLSKQDKEICDEYSTDGGKTWIKAAGWASILAAIGIGALIRIRKKKEEKWEIKKEDDSISLREDTTPFHEETHWEDEEDNDIDKDWEIVNWGDDLTIDILAEAEVYAAYWRYGQAAELLQEEVRKNPENTNAYLKLAGVYKQMKEAAKAVIDKNPTIKDSGLLKELSSFERSLSESELKKLIETAEIGSVPKNEIIVDELDMNRMDEGFRLSADWGEDFQDTKKYMKMVEFIYKRGSKEQFNQFYETTQKMEKAGFFKLSELELSQIKAWWHELDPENPIYKKEGLIIEWHITEIDNTPETILPVEQPLLITHNKPEPTHITPTEDTFPAQTTGSNDSLKKPKIMPWMDMPLKMQLKRRGFEVTKDIEAGSIHIKTIREWSYLTVLDENEQWIKTIWYNETYTVNSSTLNTFLDLSWKKPRMKLEQKNNKTLYVEIIWNVII